MIRRSPAWALAALAGLLTACQPAGQPPAAKSPPPATERAAEAPATAVRPPDGPLPDTLMLTWSRDPSTTMDLMWLEEGATPSLAEAARSTYAFSIPRLDRVAIDGDAGEWENRGLVLEFLTLPDGKLPDVDDLHATAALAWDDAGLLLRATVTDDQLREGQDPGKLVTGDAFILEVLNPDRPKERRVFVAAPPVAPDKPGRFELADQDFPEDAKAQPVEAVVRTVPDGYVVEARLPWGALGLEPRTGTRLDLALAVNDDDKDEPDRRLVWVPSTEGYEGGEDVIAAQLGGEGTGTVVRTRVQLTPEGGLFVSGPASLGRKKVEVWAGERKLAEAELTAEGGVAATPVDLPPPPAASTWGALVLRVEGKPVGATRGMPLYSLLPPPARTVAYGPKDSGRTAATAVSSTQRFGNTRWFLHSVSLKELEPGTRYAFRVGESAPGEFATAPAALTRPLVFAEGGDIGTAAVVGPLLREAAAWDPLFALVGGDLAYDNGVKFDRVLTWMRLWNANMAAPDGRLIPILACIGNHEVTVGYNGTRAQAPFFYALFGQLFPKEGYATLDFGDYLSLVLLNTNHTEPIAGAQTAFLDTALDARAQVPHLFVAYHVPAWPSCRVFDDGLPPVVRANWVPLFDKHRPALVFEHHDHAYKRTYPLLDGTPQPAGQGVVYVGDGAWGRGPRTPKPDRPYLEKALASLNVIRVTLNPDGTQDYLVVDASGKEIDRFQGVRDRVAKPD